MVYGSFAGSTGNCYCYGLLLTVWSALFLSNMVRKDASIMKKEGGKLYIKNSYMIWPKLMESHLLNLLIIVSLCIFFRYDYSVGGIITKLKK